jgi:hypothetical protein
LNARRLGPRLAPPAFRLAHHLEVGERREKGMGGGGVTRALLKSA